MKTELEQFKSLWDNKETRAQAKEVAENYVETNLTRLSAIYGDLNLPEIVSQIDFYRTVGREESVVEADMWLLAYFEPQQIGGEARIVRRLRGK